MTEKELAILNCNEYFRQHLNSFIEGFVLFYGEEYRDEIKEKFENALLIGYQDINETNLFIKEIEKKYTQIYLKEELKNVGMEELAKFFYSDISFENSPSMLIRYFEKYYELYLLGEEKRKEQFIDEGLKNLRNVKPDATMEEYLSYLHEGNIPHEFFVGHPRYIYNNALYFLDMKNADANFIGSRDSFFTAAGNDLSDEDKKDFIHSEKFNKYLLAYECYKKALIKYEKLQEQLHPYKEYVKKTKEFEKTLHQKYFKDYVMSCKFLFTDSEINEIKNYFNSTVFVMKPKVLNILSDSIHYIPPIYYFNEVSQNRLDSETTDIYEKNTIMRERVSYFRAKGLDLGDDYQSYVESDEAKKIWPSIETVNKVLKIREKFANDFNNEYYINTSRHKEIRKEITDKGMLEVNDDFNAALYTQHGTMVSANVVRKDGILKLFPMLIAHITDGDEYLDHAIVHELNHLFELVLLGANGSKVEYLCGWDYIESDLSEESKEVDTLNKRDYRRGYELFNEVINELIAQDISKKMIENNIHVFNDESNYKFKGYTAYEQTLFLIKDFYNEFREDIIKSRRQGNIEIIFNKVGKENFDRLNKLFSIFNENFGGLKYYELVADIRANVQNEKTKLYYDLKRERNEIMNDMRNYNKSDVKKI